MATTTATWMEMTNGTEVLFEGTVYYVVGTQTGDTDAWTGDLPSGVTAYFNGLTINYYLPYEPVGNGASLQLGNLYPREILTKKYFFNEFTEEYEERRVTKEYHAGSIIPLVFRHDTWWVMDTVYTTVENDVKTISGTDYISESDGVSGVRANAFYYEWESVQRGSGIPSPSNIRNIPSESFIQVNQHHPAAGMDIEFYADWRYTVGKVFGFIFDATEGTLTLTRWGQIFDGTETSDWGYAGSGSGLYFTYWNGDASKRFMYSDISHIGCSHFANKPITTSTTDINVYSVTSTGGSNPTTIMQFRPDLSTIPDIYAWLNYLQAQYANDTPVTAWYEIEESQRPVYNLTPWNITIYDGQNTFTNMLANGATLTLKYSATTGAGLMSALDKAKLDNIPYTIGSVESVTIEATSPIVVDDSTAITTSGTRTLSHATSGVTADSYGDTSAQTPAFGGTFKVPSLTVDEFGHITTAGEHNVTIPACTILRDGYGRYRTGTYQIFADSLCVRTDQGYLTSLTTTGGTGTSKEPIPVGFRPEKIYYSTTAYAANAATASSAIFLHYSTTKLTNTFNSTPSTYSSIFLCGTYDQTTGLFTLDTTSTTSWYKYQRYNGATASVFTAGKDYIRVGQNYSTAGYFQLEMVNTMYHFDGTYLIPYFGGGVYTSTTFTDSQVATSPTRTITRQGIRVHMSWGDTYSLTAGSWITLTSDIPAAYRPANLERRSVPIFADLNTWRGYAIVEVSSAGVMRIGSSYTGTAVVEVDMTYDTI